MHLNMKRIFFGAVLFLCLQVSAQQHFTDSIYKPKAQKTLTYAEKDGQRITVKEAVRLLNK